MEKTAVFYLTKTNIFVTQKDKNRVENFEVEWNGQDPTEVFANLAGSLRLKNIRIILGGDLSYVFGVNAKDQELNRDHIHSIASSVIPEDISDFNFDWQAPSSSKASSTPVQVFAASQTLLNNLSFAAKKANLNIETIKPIAFLLAKAMADHPTPHLIIWRQTESVATVSYQGIAYYSEAISEKDAKSIDSILKFSQENLNMKIEQAILDWNQKTTEENIDPPSLPTGLATDTKHLDILTTFLDSKLETGSDKDILEIKPLSKPEPPQPSPSLSPLNDSKPGDQPSFEKPVSLPTKPDQVDSEVNSSPTITSQVIKEVHHQPEKPVEKPKSKNIFVIILIIILTLGLVGGGIFVATKALNQPKVSEPTPTPIPTPTPTPTPEPIDLTQYQVKVLNGSGIAGEAGKVADILETEGFVDIEAGNADSYDYTDTEVSMTKDIPSSLFTMISQLLDSKYSIASQSGELDEELDYDILITVGTPLNSTEE